MRLRSDILRTLFVLTITTTLQNVLLWQAGVFSTVASDGVRTPSTIFWIALVGYLVLFTFGVFQALPAQASAAWLFDLRLRFPTAAIPFTVWAALWMRPHMMRSHYAVALLPLTVGTLRFGRYLYQNRHELRAAPTRRQKWLAVYPMVGYAATLATVWIIAFVSIMS